MESKGLAGRRDPLWKARRRNKTHVQFPTLPSLSSRPRSIRLYQKQYNHDILVLSFSETRAVWFSNIQTGIPIQFTWTQDAHEVTWYGYVSHISRTVQASRVKEMEVHCVGASFPLKERATRVFNDLTVPEAVKIIAEENGFNFIGDPNPRRFPQLTMAGHSYWEWIQEQAKRIGFAVVVDGMNLYFREIDSLVDQLAASTPFFSAGSVDVPAKHQFYDRTLDVFNTLKGEHMEGAEHVRTSKIIGGVDPVTAQPFTASDSPNNLSNDLRSNLNDVLFSEYRTDQVANTEHAIQDAALGSAKLARFTMPAKARGQGDPRVRPFAPVYIHGTGSLTDGHWIVKEVTHLFQKAGEYTVDMLLVTDGTGPTKKSPNRKSFPEKYGTVNLQEALARSSGNAYASGKKATQLDTLSPAYKAANQGFNRTPALWTSGKVK